MKLLKRRELKKINYFGIEFELDSDFMGSISTHADGWVFATEVDYNDDFVRSIFLGIVDLEGTDWKDTLMEIE
jgi:hypothetical protein